MRYHKPRRGRFRPNNKGYGKNGLQELGSGGIGSALNNFQRKSFGRNGYNPEKLLEKYNLLAKEALSNGDKILSESYYQYADHFLRVIEYRNSKNNNPKPHLHKSQTEKNPEDKIILEDKKNSSSQQSKNNEEI